MDRPSADTAMDPRPTGAARIDVPTPRRWLHAASLAVAFGLLAGWVGLWTVSVRRDTLFYGGTTWIPALPFLAGDFRVHVDHVARMQAAGVDVYRNPCDFACDLYPYPPMIARCFGWVVFFNIPTASLAWQMASALILVAAALGVYRARGELGLTRLPWPWIVVGVLYSTPALFVLERGQVDTLILLSLLAASWLLGRKGIGAELAAGALLGATAWIKYYPGASIVALLAFGRWRGVVAFVAVAGGIGLYDRAEFWLSVANGAQLQSFFAQIPNRTVLAMQHSLVENWKMLRFVQGSSTLGAIPGIVVGALLLLPAVVLVARSVARSADRRPLTFPFLLWLTGAATFGMPYAVDYNLAPLVLAGYAAWDRRASWPVHLGFGLLVVWAQPFALPIDGEILLYFKLIGVYAIGYSLAERASGRRMDDAPGRIYRRMGRRSSQVDRSVDVPSASPEVRINGGLGSGR